MDQLKVHFFLLVISLLSRSVFGTTGIVIKSCKRHIDISTSLCKHKSSSIYENKGKESVSRLTISSDLKRSSVLAYVTVKVNEVNLELVDTKVGAEENYIYYDVILPKKLQPGGWMKLDVMQVFSNCLVPYPKGIKQGEQQLMLYTGSHYLTSIYPVYSQDTKIKLFSGQMHSYTELHPSSHGGFQISLGPYANVQPNTISELKVHSENNSPFLKVEKLNRELIISQWGILKVEDNIAILHDGANLIGSFSRADYMRHVPQSSVMSFKTILPGSAADCYYRDEIGNITTSHMRRILGKVVVELRPRFPLFGGWKTFYTLGYNLPIHSSLFRKGNRFTLNVKFLDRIMSNMRVDEIKLQIVVPEGATDVVVESPFSVKRLPDERKFTYLDFRGRPVVVLLKENVVEGHIQEIQVHYNLSMLAPIREFLLVILAVFLVFVAVILFYRMDFTIHKHNLKTGGQVGRFMKRIKTIHSLRTQQYKELDNLISNFKVSKNFESYGNSVKDILQELKNLGQYFGNILEEMAGSSPEVVWKEGNDFQKLDKSIRDFYLAERNLVERFAKGNTSKSQFTEQQTQIIKKREGVMIKLEALVEKM